MKPICMICLTQQDGIHECTQAREPSQLALLIMEFLPKQARLELIRERAKALSQ